MREMQISQAPKSIVRSALLTDKTRKGKVKQPLTDHGDADVSHDPCDLGATLWSVETRAQATPVRRIQSSIEATQHSAQVSTHA